ncbi:MAG: hypothetical protein KC636_16155 [Myxococcales bacterium]|nr:hypothetical protein [Myxococcales bacterium]
MSSRPDPGLEQSFQAALQAAEKSPASDDAWDHLEELVDSLQRPEDVAELYRKMLGAGLEKSIHDHLAERAVQFHEEWFGDNPSAIARLLSEILDHDAEAHWAFDRITVILTAAERWDELLAAYDRALAVTRDGARSRQLLADAAQVARDFAGNPDRAADYMVELLASDPDNLKLETSLARLLERQERWADLIEIYRSKLGRLAPVEARQLRVEIAGYYLDRLRKPDLALGELATVVEEAVGHPEACAELERILVLEGADTATRREALNLLRTNFDAIQRPRDVIAALEKAVSFTEGAELRALHRELGSRLSILGEDTAAMGHYGILLRLDPSDGDARKQLRQLAQRGDGHELLVEALVAAADAASDGGLQVGLLLEAAHLQRDVLGDAEVAINLYRRVVETPDAELTAALTAAHLLNELLSVAGRREERLAVLEGLAKLERVTVIRQAVLGEAARLAAELGELDRALGAWERRLALDESDLEALNEVIELLAKAERWPALTDALRRRADGPVSGQQRRADLVRIARVQSKELGDLTAAIDTWMTVREQFGEDPEVVAALDEVMAAAGRHGDLAVLIEGAASRERREAGGLLTRVADINRRELARPEHAVELYAQALRVDPGNEGARRGIRELLQAPRCVKAATHALVVAYRETDDWQEILALLEPRLSAQDSARERAALLREAAELHEQRAGDVASAHAALVRALPLDPYDLSLESDFLRLTEASARWLEAADALKAAVDEASDTPARAAQLSHAEGELRELQLDDPPRAADAFGRAAELDPRRLEYHADAARCAARAGRWDQAAAAALEAVRYRTNLEGSAIEAIEGLAAAASAHRALAEAFDPIVVSRQDSLRSSLAWALDLRIASWFRAAGELAGAERAARRAVEQRPRSVESLELLAGLQRELKSDGLVDTLLRLDDLRDSDLDGLYEASETALASERPARARATLIRLYRKSARMWARGETASGERTEEHSARWALERLVELHTAANETEQAVRLLLDGATLPFPAALSRALRQRAAEMLAEQGQRDRAIDLYVGVLADRGDDRDVEVGVLQRVAALCEQEGRTTELLGLRFQELALVDDVDRRIELRLEIARLTGVLEARRSRVEVLRDNLKDKPGHDASIAALEALLVERGRLRELTEVLEEQAATLTAAGEQERAAGLWGRVARLSEESLEDPERAIAAHTRAVALAPSAAIFDALARLQLAQGRPEEAALWLEKRLEHAADSERVAIRIKLARAYIAAAMPVDAVAVLEQAFEDAPKNGEVRKLLINLYRERETWDKLADALTQAARHVSDADTVLAYAREAASLYHERLDQPERSVEVLERAVAHADSDRRLKTMLADGYRAAGRNAEARALLESIIEGYGRRRSASRARAHLRLAKVLHALGETEGAIEQLETASRMDAGDVVILQTLAALARDAGQLDRAERAYRTLLINVRRVLQAGKEEPEVGPCEVLFELSRIARARGDDLRADELIESGLEAVGESDAELTRLEGSLRARGDYELLQRVLETRLGQLRGGHQRAELLGQLADLYDKLLDRPRDAFEARLKALEMEPASPLHYDPARDLAARLGDVERYTELLERLLTATRRESDAHVRCELLLRLAEVKEKEQQDYQGASRLLDQAEATGVRKVDVWRAQARVAGASGHTELQMALLEQLVSLGANQAETRADALYRMAEVHLASEETVLDGIEALSRALADSAHYERAGLIIRSACEHLAPREELLELYEEVARRSSDDALLLHFLEHRAKNPGADVRGALDLAREGAALAGELDEWDRAEALMLRAVELSEEAAEGRAAADWALLGLAQRRHDSGDTAGAVKWLSEAIEVAFNNQVLELGRAVAEQAGGPGGDLTLAAKLYERLVEREPTSRATWEPLAQIYRKLGDIDRLERLVDETLDGLSDPAERNALRLELAGAFLSADGRGDDAVRVLNDILREAPDNDDAQALLAEHLERTGDTEGLL